MKKYGKHKIEFIIIKKIFLVCHRWLPKLNNFSGKKRSWNNWWKISPHLRLYISRKIKWAHSKREFTSMLNLPYHFVSSSYCWKWSEMNWADVPFRHNDFINNVYSLAPYAIAYSVCASSRANEDVQIPNIFNRFFLSSFILCFAVSQETRAFLSLLLLYSFIFCYSFECCLPAGIRFFFFIWYRNPLSRYPKTQLSLLLRSDFLVRSRKVEKTFHCSVFATDSTAIICWVREINFNASKFFFRWKRLERMLAKNWIAYAQKGIYFPQHRKQASPHTKP